MTPYIWTIIIGLVLLYAVISGFIKGLLSQIGQIAGLIVGVLAARALTPSLLAMLRADSTTMFATVLCYLLVFLAGYFAIVLLARLVKLVVRVACLGVLDRIGGALFKLIKWTLILSLVYNLCVSVTICDAPNASDNWLERTVYRVAPAVLDMWHHKTS